MIALIYNEISKVIAQRRFVMLIIFVTLLAIISALFTRGTHNFSEAIAATAAQLVSGTITGGSAQLFYPFLFALIIGDIIAGEVSAGTIKLLLIRPVSRWKIWLSKLVAAFLTSTLIVIYCAICTYVALGAAVGFGSWGAPELIHGLQASAASVTLRVYALELVSIFAVVCTFMLISTAVEAGVAAVALCTMLAVICSILVPILSFVVQSEPGAQWVQYLFFEHWQIAGLANSTFPMQGWSIEESIGILAVWSVLFIAAGIALFEWKDVKG